MTVITNKLCAHSRHNIYCGSYIVVIHTEIQTGSSTGAGVIIIGSVLGVLTFVAMAVIITFSAILCLIKKGIVSTHYFSTLILRLSLSYLAFLTISRVCPNNIIFHVHETWGKREERE